MYFQKLKKNNLAGRHPPTESESIKQLKKELRGFRGDKPIFFDVIDPKTNQVDHGKPKTKG